MNVYQIFFDNMNIDDLNVVLKVAEFNSIKKAAESLDIQTATASAAVKRVEKRFGMEFFIRSTRNLRLSSGGEKHIPQIEEAILLLNQIGQHAKEEQKMVDGTLRLAVPSDLGRNVLLPWLDVFTDNHPNLSLKLHLSDSNVDFYRDPVDVALRYGTPKDSGMYGFKICNVPRVLCASPTYIETTPSLHSLSDLKYHNGLLYQLNDILHDVWEFTRNKQVFKVKMSSIKNANDAEVVRRWCVAGKGIAVKSVLDMSDDLIHGRLISFLTEYKPKPTELWLICPSRQLITPAVRLLRETITERCRVLLDLLAEKGILERD